MRWKLRPAAAVLASAAVTLASGRASAVERVWHLGGSFGFAQLSGGPTSAGFGGTVNLGYQLGDMFEILGAASVTAHPYGQWMVASGGVGVAYLVDTARWTPWVGALAGPAGIISTDPLCGAAVSEPCRAFRISLEIPWGLDYQLTPRLAVGAAGRFQMLLLGDSPWMTLGAYARVVYSWGR